MTKTNKCDFSRKLRFYSIESIRIANLLCLSVQNLTGAKYVKLIFFFVMLLIANNIFAVDPSLIKNESKKIKLAEEKYHWMGENDDEKRKIGKWVNKSVSGKIKKIIHYKKGIKHGVSITYRSNGDKQAESNYKEGLLDGNYEIYFINSALKLKKHYKKDLLDGKYAAYYKSGRKRTLKNYINDIIDGTYAKYFDNGKNTLESKGYYVKGKKSGTWQKWTEYGVQVNLENYKNGLRHGTNKYYIFGNLFKNEQYKFGRRQGNFVEYFLDKKKKKHIEGSYNKGLSNGTWVYWRYSGNEKKKTIQYKSGKLSGIKIIYDDYGRIWKKYSYSKNKLNGTYTEYFSELKDKVRLIGAYVDNQKVGAWTHYLPDSKNVYRIVFYKNDKKDGMSKFYYASGKIAKLILYLNGKKHGNYLAFFDLNKKIILEKGQYLNGKKTGLWLTQYSKGSRKREKIMYEKGKRQGAYLKYYPSGNVWIRSNYMRGSLQGQYSEYYDNRNKWARQSGSYDKAEKTGFWIYRYPTGGQKREKISYLNGKKQGIYIKFYKSGNIWIQSKYENGSLHGKYVEYYDSGRSVKRKTGQFEKGKKMGFWYDWSQSQSQKRVILK